MRQLAAINSDNPNQWRGSPDVIRSLPDAAAIIGVSLSTLRRLIEAHSELKVIRLSARRVGIRQSALEAYLSR